MKKIFLLCFFNLSLLFGGTYTEKEMVPPTLLELLTLMDVPHDGTFTSIVQLTQKKWLRPAGKERWEMNEIDATKKQRVLELADKLGFVSSLHPCKKEYDYCVLLGATVGRMQLRLNHIISLWEEGIRFRHLVFLTGERPLDSAVETLCEDYKNESQAMHYIWENTPLPKDLSALPVTFIDVPMIATKTSVRRPTTPDTFIAWLATKPQPGSCLLIANQPFCLYQHETAKSCLPKDFDPETVGLGGQIEGQHAAVLLDSIARWLYQIAHNSASFCESAK